MFEVSPLEEVPGFLLLFLVHFYVILLVLIIVYLLVGLELLLYCVTCCTGRSFSFHKKQKSSLSRVDLLKTKGNNQKHCISTGFKEWFILNCGLSCSQFNIHLQFEMILYDIKLSLKLEGVAYLFKIVITGWM